MYNYCTSIFYSLRNRAKRPNIKKKKMKGTSKVIMAATLVMVVTLAVVLALILVLLADLYCSLLLRRRRHLRNTLTTTTIASPSSSSPPSPTHFPQQQSPPFGNIYSHGVLQAPSHFLFPSHAPKSHNSELLPQIQISHPHHQIGLISSSSSLPPSNPTQHVPYNSDDSSNTVGEHLVYISNPMYDNEEANKCSSGADTSFETPDSSPSRLERSGSSGDDDDVEVEQCGSPPLAPMKKLPAEACSVSLSNGKSLVTSGSDSHSINGPSSSSSASPCTSPSW